MHARKWFAWQVHVCLKVDENKRRVLADVWAETMQIDSIAHDLPKIAKAPLNQNPWIIYLW